MFLPLLFLAIGLIVLIIGGEIFIKGSASLAKKLKISPIVIGLTVVAFGTSVAELFVNILAAIQGATDLAIGNILGSNIANVFLVLGVAALITKLKIKHGTAWKELPLSILAIIVLFIIGNDVWFSNEANANFLSRGDGMVLLCFFLIFLYYTYGLSKAEGEKDQDLKTYSWMTSIFFILFGILGIMGGAQLMVTNGVVLGELFGLSQLFIGVTIVAIGTSLPELATSVIAAYHGHDDLVVGNTVGSNIFNILWILGLTPIVSPIPVNSQINVDIVIAILSVVLLFIFMFTGYKHHRYHLRRWQGIVFLLLYASYMVYVFYRG